MKRITLKTLKPKEWITLLVGLAAAAAIYMVLIRPSEELFSKLGEAQAARAKAENELTEIRDRLLKVQKEIVEGRRKLAELGGSPPLASEKDLQIARITALAGKSRIAVDQYLPVDTIDESDHRATFVHFTGRGDFTSIIECFKRIESEIDFVDITHFSITAPDRGATSQCVVNWSCRINGLRVDGVKPGVPAGAMARATSTGGIYEP